MEVTYNQGMTNIWSDGEKIKVVNLSGTKHLASNVEQIFGMGEWTKIQTAIYYEVDHLRDHRTTIRGYECVSGYIPQRVVDDIADLNSPTEDELPEDVERQNALETLKDV